MKRKNNLPKVKVDVVVNVKKQVMARVRNMIDMGVCLLTSELLEKGKILTLEVSYHGREKLKIKGKVMWSLKIKPRIYENGIDFKFANITRKENFVRFLS